MKKISLLLVMLVGLFALTGNVKAERFPDFTKLVEEIQPSVVSIKVDVRQRGRIGQAGGSGFIIDKDGHILTNHHVVANSDKVAVKLNSGREYQAKIIGSDQFSDVALIKIDPKGLNLQPVKIGSSRTLKVGEWVLAFGAPFNLEQTVTAGIVSAKGRGEVGSPFVPFIQTDVAINSGNSGGPLINLDGEVVGINSMIYNPMISTGLSFSIPIDLADSVSDQLAANGQVIRGYLGVGYEEVDQGVVDYFELPTVGGALINNVQADSPAKKAGIERGDIITEVDGNRIKSHQDLPYFIAQIEPGSKVKLKGYRNGKSKNFFAELVAREATGQQLPAASEENRLGIEVNNIGNGIRQQLGVESGVVVTQVEPGSPAQRAGIKQGDIISELNQRQIEDTNDFNKALEDFRRANKLLILITDASGSDYRIVYLN
ncbi:trypsin-like peptidase domain-containing protein [Kangiella sp. HZ709]|uniref:trypsin-like peptidase domain-containing protein n=1 Tax=Kangiella sp. HZ709 TaxID=2666328 RepID=UPI0018A212F9|nr:trypsin-like peptidase domain-containing protein [Kangiella sp. HZ709]